MLLYPFIALNRSHNAISTLLLRVLYIGLNLFPSRQQAKSSSPDLQRAFRAYTIMADDASSAASSNFHISSPGSYPPSYRSRSSDASSAESESSSATERPHATHRPSLLNPKTATKIELLGYIGYLIDYDFVDENLCGDLVMEAVTHASLSTKKEGNEPMARAGLDIVQGAVTMRLFDNGCNFGRERSIISIHLLLLTTQQLYILNRNASWTVRNGWILAKRLVLKILFAVTSE